MNKIETIYPLSPLQQGMLFHTLYAPHSGVYFQQINYTLRGNLDMAAFKKAWQLVVDRHPALRSAFIWERRDKPLQVVQQGVNVPWDEQDWRGQPPTEQQERLDALLCADRARGFALNRAPLIRMALIRLTDDTYRFIWGYHHILLDGWSVPLILREVFIAYQAFCRGKSAYLERRRPYADYIAWLQQQSLAEAEAFWRQTLKGFTAPTPLSVDHVVGSSGSRSDESTHYAEQRLELPAVTTAALQRFARQQRVTLNTIAQGAWALLLSHYSGEEDVVFGTTVSGRPAELAGVEDMVGLFINTLPVRVRVMPQTSVLSWLKGLQTEQLEMRQYEYSPLVEVQRWSEVPRGLSLFESVLIFENFPEADALLAQIDDLEVREEWAIRQTNYPLTVMAESGKRFSWEISYDSRRFTDATIGRMLGHLQTVIEGMVARPEQRLADVPLLSAAERQQIVVEWNTVPASYSTNSCIHQLIEEQTERTPEVVAVTFADQQLTYHELNARANQVAHYLRRLGVGPETLVGICMERSLDLIVGLLGILKAGGAYVPLDPAYPPERLAYMLHDTQAPIMLVQHRMLAKLPPQHRLPEQHVCLDTGWADIAGESTANPHSGVVADNLAYIMYTSGSTGRPKGVPVSHRAIGNRLLWAQAIYPLTTADRVLQVTSYSFDITLWEIFGPLLAGACLALARPSDQQVPTYLVPFLREQAITVAYFLPSLLQVLVEEEGLAACTTLRGAYTGGEVVPPDLPNRLFGVLAGGAMDLISLYGPTEAAISATFWVCQRGHQPHTLPIGRPIPNMQVYVLDHRRQPVPIGVAGEVYIGGIGLARGYLHRPDLTAEKFIPDPFPAPRFARPASHPFSGEPGARLYRTGDLARYLPSGDLEYLGRGDDQVKIRGVRIEPAEIEAILAQHPTVREAIVLAREDVPGEKRLVAYIVPRVSANPALQGQGMDSDGWNQDLRRYLSALLPDYMTPSAFVVLEAFPLTPNGKVDRRALPAPATGRSRRQGHLPEPQKPRDHLELQLIRIFEDVLPVHPIGVTDNFFELGGHSLLAVRLVAQIHRQLGKQISLAALFTGATVEQIARILRRQDSAPSHPSMVTGSSPSPLVPIQSGGTKRPLFCIHAGAGTVLCYHELAQQLGSDQPLYALQAPGLQGECAPLTSIEAMATRYREAIQGAQAQGPYNLLGWCLGGLVALEIARQLHQQGQEISLLALLDTFPPDSDALAFLQDEVALVEAFMGDFIRPFAPDLPLYAYQDLQRLEPDQRFAYLVDLARQIHFLPPDTEPTQLRFYLAVYRANARALHEYHPRAIYPQRITFFQASDEEESADSPARWSAFVAEAPEVHIVPGTHGTLIHEPHVRVLAEQLRHCLERAATHPTVAIGGPSADLSGGNS
jgi:surfactin family lipopeptide synthetase C